LKGGAVSGFFSGLLGGMGAVIIEGVEASKAIFSGSPKKSN